jgi:fumarate hydratase subunit beta
MIKLRTPLTDLDLSSLCAGDEVLLSGEIFTARDAAHQRISDQIGARRRLPIDLKGAVLYYAGPTPGRKKGTVGSCGPTTSSRMDAFTGDILKLGVKGMIGKGDRSDEVVKMIKKYGCVYFLATGGVGAFLSTKIKSARPVLYKDLGPEAVHRLEVEDFPLIVGVDPKGRNIYDKTQWKKRERA